MDIRFTNSRTRKKELFQPIDPDNVRIYLCGPTVYDRAHLGNARPPLVFDVLYRLLRHVYGDDHVTYVRNFTDVDDKINATALSRKEAGAEGSLEELVHERSNETIGWYRADMDALGALPPSQEPRATAFIGEMVAMIEDLVAKGHAYAAEGHVLFAVDSYKDYGALSGRSVDDMIAGARVEVAPYKKNPMDFVLWKPSTDDLPGWDSPWGRGRPGWHIECSAMAHALLGETFDIHGGGNDLTFPHHENEIAQSKCAHPEGDFARVWLHNEMLQVEGKKMSKSLGNFFTVRDLLDQGVPGEVIRFVMLSTHYRKPMDWTDQKAKEARRELDHWGRTLSFRHDFLDAVPDLEIVDQQVVEALADDLNTSLVLTRLKALARFVDNSEGFLSLSDNEQRAEEHRFANSANLVGFDVRALARAKREEPVDKDIEFWTLHLVQERISAKENKDFSEVDRLKTALQEAGVEVRMSKDGIELVPVDGFDKSKLQALK